jgi:hypothetical protein
MKRLYQSITYAVADEMALDDAGDARKSVLRSIRVSSKLAANLQREARERRVSVNSLVSSILERYNEWDMMAEKFGFVQISCETLQQLLNGLEDRELARIAREAGKNVSKDLIMFWFKEVNIDSVLRYLKLVSQYQKVFTLEFTQLDGKLVVVLHHRFAEKGSTWFSNFVAEVIKTNLRVNVTADQTKSSVKFDVPLLEIESSGRGPNGGNHDFLLVR